MQVDKYNSTPTLISSVSYSYDGFGRRVKKNVNGTVMYYIYDNEDIRFETDASGQIIAEYTHGPAIDELLSMRRGGQNYYYHSNALGSVTALTNSSKTVVQSYVYDSFGQIISQTGSITNPYTFTAREYDSETGLYYYRARYYDAKIGKFISEDPIGLNGGDMNLYTMVGNNPVNWIDPFGLEVTIRIHRGLITITANSISGVIDVSSDRTVDQFRGYTLEPIRAKGPVPVGTYDAFLRKDHSPWRIELKDVPQNKNIQIHVGNRPSESEGCFLTGTGKITDRVTDSKMAMKKILDIIQKDNSGVIKVIVE